MNERRADPGTIAEAQRQEFESDWLAGRPRPIDEYLRDVSPDRYDSTLEELVAIELEFGWQYRERIEGEPPVLELYLVRFPELNEPARLKRLMVQEYHARHRFGDQPSQVEYHRRFPGLIRSAAEAEQWLGEAAPCSRAWVAGRQVGRYKLRERFGRGGFGEVWRAFDLELNREVALKRLSESLAGNAEYRRRFLQEAATTAQLEHPGIVPVHDVDDPEAEPPYYAMRFFAGGTLAEAIAAFHSRSEGGAWHSVRQLRLFEHYLALARTVAFAHAEGVVHRDLKPHNVVLGQYGETIVLDWGLAKRRKTGSPAGSRVDESAATSHAATGAATDIADEGTATAAATSEKDATRAGAVLGTPVYMAPEQAEGRVELIDQRSDVYSLGVILFELLTGRLPRSTEGGIGDGPPSARRFRSELPRAVDAICAKALHPDRQLRYANAGELTADLERLLADEPVRAAPEPMGERVKRWLRRHRTLATTVTAVGGVATLLLAVFSLFVVLANRELAERERQARFHRDRAESSLAEATANLYFHRVLLASNELQQHNVARAEELLEGCPAELRHWEWYYLRRLCRLGDPRVLRFGDDVVRCVAYSPDGQRVAAIGRGGSVRVWEMGTEREKENEQERMPAELEFGDRPRVVLFSGDGQLLLVGGTIDRRGRVKGWNRRGERVVDFEAHRSAIGSMAVSADGRHLATGGIDRTVAIWSVGEWKRIQVLAGHEAQVTAVAFSPDGTRVVSGGYDNVVRLWDVQAGRPLRVWQGHEDQIHSVAFHPDGRHVASASHDRTIRIWDAEDREPPRQLLGHSHYVRQVAFHPRGKMLVSASFDRTARVWSFPEGDQLAVLRGHESHLRTVAVGPAGEMLATGGEEGTVRLWDLGALDVGPSAGGSILAWQPGRRRIATALKDRVRILNAAGEIIWELPRREVDVYELAFGATGRVAAGYADGVIDVWDVESRSRIARLQREGGAVLSAAFLPSDDRVLTGHLDGGMVLWNLESAEALWQARAHAGAVTCVRARADGQRLASSGKDGIVRLWTADGTRVAELTGHSATVSRVAFSSRGLIASCGYDGDVRVWSDEGRPLRRLRVGNQWVNCVDFHPDGRRLASGSEESVKLWDTRSWEQVLSLTGHPCIHELQFSSDGRSLALAGTHRQLRIWDGPDEAWGANGDSN